MTTLAIDAGRTTLRLMLIEQGAAPRCVTLPGIDTTPPASDPEGFAARIAAAAATHLTAGPGLKVAMGLAGSLLPDRGTQVLAECIRRECRATSVVVASDAVTSFLGALGPRPGVVLSIGTGAVALAVRPDGSHRFLDGAGYLLDDAGSAFDIGRKGLAQALRAADGRQGPTTLTERARARFGGTEELLVRIYADAHPVRTIAGFAPEVIAAADDGDDVAQRIVETVVNDWVNTTLAGAAFVSDGNEPIACSWAGGVLGANPQLVAEFVERLDRHDHVLPLPPKGDGINGAAQLVTASATRMFGTLIERV